MTKDRYEMILYFVVLVCSAIFEQVGTVLLFIPQAYFVSATSVSNQQRSINLRKSSFIIHGSIAKLPFFVIFSQIRSIFRYQISVLIIALTF